MKYRSIRDWPEDERPRERLLEVGACGLSTAQLLAIILRTGSRDKSALALARELLSHFGNLNELEDASIAEVSGIRGMGSAKVAQVKAAFELGRRLLRDEGSGVMRNSGFRNSREVYEYFRPKFYGQKKERFLCVLLDTKNRVFRESVISEGTLTSSPVHPREVFRYAIKEAAASVLFVHNHPSGDPAPSADDISITRRLVETGKIVGIRVLDHVIVCDSSYRSLFEENCIEHP